MAFFVNFCLQKNIDDSSSAKSTKLLKKKSLKKSKIIIFEMSYQFLDELVREHLIFRGFVSTLKTFDAEIRSEKEKGFRSDKIISEILSQISSFDLQGLRDLWQHLNARLFRRLDPTQTGAVSRLESGVLKLYLVNCVQNKNGEKVKEFFEKLSSELQVKLI